MSEVHIRNTAVTRRRDIMTDGDGDYPTVIEMKDLYDTLQCRKLGLYLVTSIAEWEANSGLQWPT